VHVAAPAVAVEHLAEQQRAAVAQPRRVPAELVARVRLRERRGARRDRVPTSAATPSERAQRPGIDAELGGEPLVEGEQLGAGAGRPAHGSYRPLSAWA
jgi:hypothetical protein